MLIELNRESPLPLYAQIVTQMREMIRRGVLKAGDRLPANRELAKKLGVNRNTITAAYEELTAEGIIRSHVGQGTFVNDVPILGAIREERVATFPMSWNAVLTDQSRESSFSNFMNIQSQKDTISLSHGLPQSELFPLEDFRLSLNRAFRKEGQTLLQLGLSGGYQPLQKHLAAQMALLGIQVTPDEVLITNGCQQSLDLISRILVRPGDEVVIENPTFPGAISVFCGANSKFLSVPVNQRGIDLDVLEDILTQRRPKLIYTVPTFQNPTGTAMDIGARRQLIELAARHRVPIIEDDIYRELRYDGADVLPLKALDKYGLVIYISSFSKVGFPGLRVGWMVAPRPLIEHLNALKQRSDVHASMLSQAAIYEFARQGLLNKHVRRAKKIYAERRDVMLEALEKYFPAEAEWNKPEGGMTIWIRLPESLNASQILLEAAKQGVIFSPGERFYASQPQCHLMRLSFTMTDAAQIELAVKRLGAIIKTQLSRWKTHRGILIAEGRRALM
ncbi:MAG: PLP-dependent aminotransferase family protein [Acidobacteria bacterium]|nr:PLP-dependent aminotransferase family protein [Acidobacteriota bacterium]